MSWVAPPDQYALQPQKLAGAGAPGSSTSNCSDHACCVPSAEAHYSAAASKTKGTTQTTADKIAIDGPNTGTLPNRMAVEFYNAGTVVFEISNQPNFNYGDGTGRPVQPNTPYAFNVGPASVGNSTLHYIACATAGPCDCRITEVGGNCG